MTRTRTRTLMLLSLLATSPLLMSALPAPRSIVPSAEGIVGRPLTPMSYAGVARRTTRRAVYATAAVPHYYPAPIYY